MEQNLLINLHSLQTEWMLCDNKLNVLWSLTLTIPSGGDKLTMLPHTRCDKRHHGSKTVCCVIQGLKIGKRSHRGGWYRKRRGHGALLAPFKIARRALQSKGQNDRSRGIFCLCLSTKSINT